MRWMWAAALAAAMSALAAPRALTAQVSDEPETPVAAARTGVGTTVAELNATLTDPATPPTHRNEAARRLVARQTDEAREALRQAVSTADNPPARVAAVSALADDPAPAPAMIPDLLSLLNNETNPPMVKAAAEALASYKGNPQVLAALSAAAARGQRNAALRIPIIRALGQLVEPAAAATLVRIATDRAEPPDVTDAAADALIEMTALEGNGRDPARWQQWLQQTASLSEGEWKAAVLRARSRREDRERRQAATRAAEIAQLLDEQYAVAPDKAATLLRFLEMATPEIRRAGARLVGRLPAERGQRKFITEEVQHRLLDLISDADPGVRRDVAQALYDVNIDPARALPPLLAQLQVETDSDVAFHIIRRLARIARIEREQDLRDLVRSLGNRLEDGSPAVVREAAVSIGRRAPQVLQQDRALAAAAAKRLRAAMTRLAQRPGAPAAEARKAAGEALAALRDPASLEFARDLLNARQPAEPPAIRGVALQILGELGGEGLAILENRIASERDPAVRVDGMRALARTRDFDRAADLLVERMDPTKETSEKVREAARSAYLELIPTGSIQKLTVEAQNRRRKMPELRVAVLRVLVQKHKEAGRLDQAAQEQQNLGVGLLELGQPAEAVPQLRAALTFLRGEGEGPDVTAPLIEQLIEALLQSRQYGELVALASELINNSPPKHHKFYQQEFGSKLSRGAEQLKNGGTPDDLDNAMALIDAALKMNPPLDPSYRQDLEGFRKEIEQLRGRRAPG